MMKNYFAEFSGTFALVFFGAGAVVVNEQYNGVITHPGIAFTFGLVILAMIYTYGNVSGAHFNPAVSITFTVLKLFPASQLLQYISAQVCGAIAASVVLRLIFQENSGLGFTHPSGSAMQSFILEGILTYFLMTVILNVSQGSKESGVKAGIAIGATIFIEALMGGPISGASMNPARSMGPSFISGHLEFLWIYISAPILGALLAGFTWKIFNRV